MSRAYRRALTSSSTGGKIWKNRPRNRLMPRFASHPFPRTRARSLWDFAGRALHEQCGCVQILPETMRPRLNFLGYATGSVSFLVYRSRRPRYLMQKRRCHPPRRVRELFPIPVATARLPPRVYDSPGGYCRANRETDYRRVLDCLSGT